MKVLVAEDDADVLDLTTYALRREGYHVLPAVNGDQALERWEAESPDLVLLDVNLPKRNGFEVCRRIRQASNTPVIMLTARAGEDDVLQGLRLGADDYVTKPFSTRQLSARIRTVLSRCRVEPNHEPVSQVRAGDLALDPRTYEACKAGGVVQLTRLEFRLLYALTRSPGRILPYDSLIQYVWGLDGGDYDALKTHVYRIRRKLHLAPNGSVDIKAVPGVGYRLAVAPGVGAPLPAKIAGDDAAAPSGE